MSVMELSAWLSGGGARMAPLAPDVMPGLSTALKLGDYALGRPFALWQASQDAELSYRSLGAPNGQYIAGMTWPYVIPSPDAIWTAYRRGLISDRTASGALLAHGVCPTEDMARRAGGNIWNVAWQDPRVHPAHKAARGKLWEAIAYMSMARPSPGDLAALNVSGRLQPGDFGAMTHGMDAHLGWYDRVAKAHYSAPGADFLLSMLRLERITPGEYAMWMTRAGWTNAEARSLQERGSTLPSLGDAFAAMWRGAISEGQLRRYGMGLGYVNPLDWSVAEIANFPLPGPAQLLAYAQRGVWSGDTVERWGLDDDMPEELATLLQWHGLNWGAGIPLADGSVIPAVPWPQVQWRASRNLLTPQEGLLAYRLSRSPRFARLQALLPDLTVFDSDDLKQLLRGYGYPPRLHSWLEAINVVPLDRRTVRQGFVLGVMPRADARQQLTDAGMTNDDADRQLDVWRAVADDRDNAPIRAFESRALANTLSELVESYTAGIIDRATLGQRLLALGVSQRAAQRAGAVADARAARAEVREALAILRRSWLSGALTPAALAQALQQSGLAPEAQARYLRRWVRQRGWSRRMLSTGQVLSAAAAGALATGVATLSLANLGWAPPDIALLLSQAAAKLAQSQARQSARVAAQAKASQREQVRALRQAQSAQRALSASLRRATPLSTLKRWFLLGIRTGRWIRDRLLLTLPDTSLVDSHLAEWTLESEQKGTPEPPAVQGTEKLARRQTGRSTVKSWWQNGVVTDAWARQRLLTMGYAPQSVEFYIREWTATLGKKPGPLTGAAPGQSVQSQSPPAGAPAPATGPAQAPP